MRYYVVHEIRIILIYRISYKRVISFYGLTRHWFELGVVYQLIGSLMRKIQIRIRVGRFVTRFAEERSRQECEQHQQSKRLTRHCRHNRSVN